MVNGCLRYMAVLMKEYRLRQVPRQRRVSSVEDIYYLLCRHWVHNQSTLRDEQQCVYVAMGILMASYFGCRPVSIYNTRLAFEGETAKKHTVVRSDYHEDSDGSVDTDTDTDGDTDDGVDAGDDMTRTLLWRHIEFVAAPNMEPQKPNILFAKVKMLHTKGEDKKPHP